jgi:hypothetical protein
MDMVAKAEFEKALKEIRSQFDELRNSTNRRIDEETERTEK